MVNTNVNGTVYLVGAGPGDPGLLTLRGAELLERADAVVYDALANPVLLERVPRDAECFDVGKRGGCSSARQTTIDRLLVRLARRHEVVVRLKGGDPFVFGRGGEEGIALQRSGVRFEVVPGVTSAVGALAHAGIPLTHRGVSSSVSFVTGHRARDPDSAHVGPMAPFPSGTLVVFMGLGRAAEIARELIQQGRPRSTPVAVVDRGTLPDQRVVEGTLDDIGRLVREARLRGPALIVVGEVVRLRSSLRPESRPPRAARRTRTLVPAVASNLDREAS